MSSTNVKVLVCDDSILARKQLKDVITKVAENAEIIDAKNGQEAIDKYKECHPDIVFLDIVMPVKDGIAAVSEIIEFDEEASIVIVSSTGTQTQLKKAIEAGARDFIQKPFSAAQVEKLINAHMEGE